MGITKYTNEIVKNQIKIINAFDKGKGNQTEGRC